jgi:hypothetical protein
LKQQLTLDEWVELHAYERIRGPLGPPRDDRYSDRQVLAAVAPHSDQRIDLNLPWQALLDDDDGEGG